MWMILAAGCFLTKYVPMVDLRELGLEKIGMWSLCAIMISVGLIFLFQQTVKLPLGFMELIGKNTLLIMCTHLDFKVPIYCMMLAEQLVAISPRAKNYVYWGTLFLSLVAIEIIIIVVWNCVKKIFFKKFSSGQHPKLMLF